VITVTNKVAAEYTNIDVTISSIFISENTDIFKISSETCPNVLTVGASCTVTVIFIPVDTGFQSSHLRIVTVEEGTASAYLNGSGREDLSFSNTSIDFGDVPVNGSSVSSVQVTNDMNDNAYLTVSSSQVFQTSHNCGLLEAGASCTINITFSPTSTGTQTRTIDVSWTDGSQSISVQGKGISEDESDNDTTSGCFIGTTISGNRVLGSHVEVRNNSNSDVIVTQ